MRMAVTFPYLFPLVSARLPLMKELMIRPRYVAFMELLITSLDEHHLVLAVETIAATFHPFFVRNKGRHPNIINSGTTNIAGWKFHLFGWHCAIDLLGKIQDFPGGHRFAETSMVGKKRVPPLFSPTIMVMNTWTQNPLSNTQPFGDPEIKSWRPLFFKFEYVQIP